MKAAASGDVERVRGRTHASRGLRGLSRVVAAGWLAAAAAAASADDYADFRIPAHTQTDWEMSLGAGGSRSSSSFNYLLDHGASRRSSLNGSTSTGLAWLSDSDPSVTYFSAQGGLVGDRRWDASNALYDRSPIEILTIEDSRSTRNVGESWQLVVSQRTYPWAFPLGFSATVSGQGMYSQGWLHSDRWSLDDLPGLRTETRERARSEAWRYEHLLGVSAGIGVGRVRDATAIYEAEILERRLQALGVLTRPLSAAARRGLAALFYQRGSVSSLRERPGRTLWKEVERILGDDGALAPQGLDPYAVLRAGEPLYAGAIARDGLPSSPIGRLRGFFVGPLLSEIHIHNVIRGASSQFRQDIVNDTLQPPQDFSVGYRSDHSFDRVLVGGRGEFHRPVGPRWQLDGWTQVTVPVRKGDEGFDLASVATATSLLADRWLASASLQHQRRVHRSSPNGIEVTDTDEWRAAYSVSGSYYLEDRLNLQLALTGNQGHSRSPFSESSGWSTGIQLSLGYRIMGRYNAPGTLGVVPLGAGE